MAYLPLQLGDHVYVDLGEYQHHGIYCGSGEIIHYSGKKQIKSQLARNFSRDWTLEIRVREYIRCHQPEVVILNARSRLAETEYNIIFNNCEHFATWCKTGERRSKQIEKIDRTLSKAVQHYWESISKFF